MPNKVKKDKVRYIFPRSYVEENLRKLGKMWIYTRIKAADLFHPSARDISIHANSSSAHNKSGYIGVGFKTFYRFTSLDAKQSTLSDFK